MITRNIAAFYKVLVGNLRLPAENEHVWNLFEGSIKKKIIGQISPEMQVELINSIKKYNDSMIPIIAAFSQKNAKYFSKYQNKKIRENLQDLINNIFFDHLELELEKQLLKKKIFDQFIASMPVSGEKQ